MLGDDFRDIVAFIAVAKERSFTKAAAQLGVSQSALSHTMRSLEERLGLRLLTRTTRSVSPTEAGERLLERVAPRFEVIAEELASLSELSNKLTGAVRISATDFAFNMFIWPKLSKILKKYPDISLEVSNEPALTDIVSERYDAGIRFGDQIGKNMTAIPISPDLLMTVVASPSYFREHPAPSSPAELSSHICISTRFSAREGISAWKFQQNGKEQQIKCEGKLVFNSLYPVLDASLAGLGLAYVPDILAQPYLSSGQLTAVLQEWCPTLPGLHIYYSREKQILPALSLIVDTLRYRR
ncbi:LysR family transcriptional regulator [Klebsiella pneumoniae]